MCIRDSNNPVWKNGTFTVIYKSDSTAHNITAVLDNEVQNLLFNEINMSVETSDLVCGENATVSVISVSYTHLTGSWIVPIGFSMFLADALSMSKE